MRRQLLLLILTILPLAVFAAVEIDGIYYKLDAGSQTAKVMENPYKYSGDISIPESVIYEGVSYIVTSIYGCAFANCSNLTSIIIPNSIISMDSECFYNCSGLTNITIPNSVTFIGFDAFGYCSGLTNITIPSNVTTIEPMAFRECTSLVSVTIPNSLTLIENSLFENCTSLTSVTIPNSVTSIVAYAFRGCSSLPTITIPSSVTSIQEDAFWDCSCLTDVYCLCTEPPSAVWLSFPPNVTFHVPEDCKEKYMACYPWKDWRVVEIGHESDDNPDDNPEDNPDVNPDDNPDVNPDDNPDVNPDENPDNKPDDKQEEEKTNEVKLIAYENKGLVVVQCNTIPNDNGYRIYRTDANGVKITVDKSDVGIYPATIQYIDNPPAGTYSYEVKVGYSDKDGVKTNEKSNIVYVKISAAMTEEEAAKNFGNILGRIECDKNPLTKNVKIKFSDGVTVTSAGKIFVRQKVKVGEKLTISVSGDDAHNYESTSIKVKAGVNNITIKGTLKDNYKPNKQEYDLAACSELKQTVEDGKHHVKFSVQNLSSSYKWEGYVRVKAVSKSSTAWQYWTDTKPTYYGEFFIQDIGRDAIVDVDIILKDLELKKDTEFEVYLESYGKWIISGMDENYEEKTMIMVVNSNTFEFPMGIRINKTSNSQKWDKEAQEDFGYLMLALSSVTPGMDGMVGDLAPYREEVLNLTNAIGGVEKMFEWVRGWTTALEAINDPNVYNITSVLKGIYNDIKNGYSPLLVDKYWASIVGSVSQEVNADVMLVGMKDLYSMIMDDAGTSEGAFEVSMSCASMLYQLASLGNAVPLTSMLYSYMVVGESLINKAKQFAPIMNSRYILGRLIHNDPYYGTDNNRVNTAVDFKLVVNKESWIGSSPIDFTDPDVNMQITDICVKAAANENDRPAEFTFYPVYMKDGVMLRTDSRGARGNWSILEEQNDLKVLYMEISWRNGKKTIIPLGESANGIDISVDGADIQGVDHFEDFKPVVYTVSLTTTTGKKNMADELYLGSNKNRK